MGWSGAGAALRRGLFWQLGGCRCPEQNGVSPRAKLGKQAQKMEKGRKSSAHSTHRMNRSESMGILVRDPTHKGGGHISEHTQLKVIVQTERW